MAPVKRVMASAPTEFLKTSSTLAPPAPAPAAPPIPAPATAYPSLQQGRQESNSEMKDILQILLKKMEQILFMMQQQMVQHSQFLGRILAFLFDQWQLQLTVDIGNGQVMTNGSNESAEIYLP